MSDIVFMGDSLNNEGSHNIIEPFALQKPVIVGPSIWGIEYPALEALDVGILKKMSGRKELSSALISAYYDKKRMNSDKSHIKDIEKYSMMYEKSLEDTENIKNRINTIKKKIDNVNENKGD